MSNGMIAHIIMQNQKWHRAMICYEPVGIQKCTVGLIKKSNFYAKNKKEEIRRSCLLTYGTIFLTMGYIGRIPMNA